MRLRNPRFATRSTSRRPPIDRPTPTGAVDGAGRRHRPLDRAARDSDTFRRPVLGGRAPWQQSKSNVASGVGIIRLNRPEARNAVNGDLATGVEAVLDDFEADDDIQAVVITGNGPTFCAGADLKLIAAGKGGEMATAKGNFAGIVTARTSRSRSSPRSTGPRSPAASRSSWRATSSSPPTRRSSASPR